jgi:hypothetical protein
MRRSNLRSRSDAQRGGRSRDCWSVCATAAGYRPSRCGESRGGAISRSRVWLGQLGLGCDLEIDLSIELRMTNYIGVNHRDDLAHLQEILQYDFNQYWD